MIDWHHYTATPGGFHAPFVAPDFRPMLYIAGPYTHPDPVANTRAALAVGDVVYRETGWLPVVPHLSLLAHLVTPHGPQHWYDFDLRLLEHCAGIVRLPGVSPGADREEEHAERIGLARVPFLDLPRAAIDAWNSRDPD